MQKQTKLGVGNKGQEIDSNLTVSIADSRNCFRLCCGFVLGVPYFHLLDDFVALSTDMLVVSYDEFYV